MYRKKIQVKGETEGAGRSLNLSSQSLGGSRESKVDLSAVSLIDYLGQFP